ncbi:hypothetical protein S7335_562 [Synechococcus sp. PCC 7335]|nr:hypothetical protein S7335_562 [Synechococcus sp. PCC 7335]
MTGAENATFLPPFSSVANPVGFVAPAILQSHQPLAVRRMMAKVAVRLAHDPMAMQLFCDRIYQLLSEDVRSQHERAHRHSKRY